MFISIIIISSSSNMYIYIYIYTHTLICLGGQVQHPQDGAAPPGALAKPAAVLRAPDPRDYH